MCALPVSEFALRLCVSVCAPVSCASVVDYVTVFGCVCFTGLGCFKELCTSPDGKGGFDCWAGGGGEKFSCRYGYQARKTGQSVDYLGRIYEEYSCCSEDSVSSITSCRRLWCGSSVGAWALGGSALALVGTILLNA